MKTNETELNEPESKKKSTFIKFRPYSLFVGLILFYLIAVLLNGKADVNPKQLTWIEVITLTSILLAAEFMLESIGKLIKSFSKKQKIIIAIATPLILLITILLILNYQVDQGILREGESAKNFSGQID